MPTQIGRALVIGVEGFQAPVRYALHSLTRNLRGGSIDFSNATEAYAAFSNNPKHKLVLVLEDGRKMTIMYMGGRSAGGEFMIVEPVSSAPTRQSESAG